MLKRIHITRKSWIPKGAVKVFTGEIFDVYQWKQKMFDGSYKTFEMLKRPDTAVIIPVVDKNKILIEEQEQPFKGKFYSFPGGIVEDIKNIDREALRELAEETGYVPGVLKYLKSVDLTSKIDWLVHIFIGQNCRQVLTPNPEKDGEKISLRLLTLDELIELVFLERFRLRGLDIEFLEAKYDAKKRKELERLLFS